MRNALGKDLMQTFRRFLHELNFDKECRTVIIKSNVEGIFCAGADLKVNERRRGRARRENGRRGTF